jgi:hypothetical protein
MTLWLMGTRLRLACLVGWLTPGEGIYWRVLGSGFMSGWLVGITGIRGRRGW